MGFETHIEIFIVGCCLKSVAALPVHGSLGKACQPFTKPVEMDWECGSLLPVNRFISPHPPRPKIAWLLSQSGSFLCAPASLIRHKRVCIANPDLICETSPRQTFKGGVTAISVSPDCREHVNLSRSGVGNHRQVGSTGKGRR